MINPDIFAKIQRALRAIEHSEGVRVFYACESGSLTWGFASSDSDYDVRFIYAHPRDHYLSVFVARDVIELNGVVAGNIVEDRARFSVAAFMQALGPPSRVRVDGRTQRITWNDEGIQLEAIAQESVVFAVLFEFANVDSTNQGRIPNQPYRGTLDSWNQAVCRAADRRSGNISFCRRVQ